MKHILVDITRDIDILLGVLEVIYLNTPKGKRYSINTFENIFDKIKDINTKVVYINKEVDIHYNLKDLQEKLEIILNAFEDGDSGLLADVLEHELVPIFKNLKYNIKSFIA